jgi:hypothetical protein
LISIDNDILPGTADGDRDISVEASAGRANRGFELSELISIRIPVRETPTLIGERLQPLTDDRVVDNLTRISESVACTLEGLTTHTSTVDAIKYNYSDFPM